MKHYFFFLINLIMFCIFSSYSEEKTEKTAAEIPQKAPNQIFSTETDKAWADFQKKFDPEEASAPELSKNGTQSSNNNDIQSRFNEDENAANREKDVFLDQYWKFQGHKKNEKSYHNEKYQAPNFDE